MIGIRIKYKFRGVNVIEDKLLFFVFWKEYSKFYLILGIRLVVLKYGYIGG